MGNPEGYSKEFVEELVVRIWRNTYKMKFGKRIPTKHVGHSALSVRGNKDGGTGKHTYISWWPEEGLNMERPLDLLKTYTGSRSTSYYDDQASEMSNLTIHRLNSGEYSPRQGQKKWEFISPFDARRIVRWRQAAEAKIYLPCINEEDDKIWFGFSAKRIREWWDYFLTLNNPYKLFSKTLNCSGVVGNALRIGGGEAFVEYPGIKHYVSPVDIEKWAKELKTRLDDLNKKCKWFQDKYEDDEDMDDAIAERGVQSAVIYSSNVFRAYVKEDQHALGVKQIFHGMGMYHCCKGWPRIEKGKHETYNPMFVKKLKGMVLMMEGVHHHLSVPRKHKGYASTLPAVVQLGRLILEELKSDSIEEPAAPINTFMKGQFRAQKFTDDWGEQLKQMLGDT